MIKNIKRILLMFCVTFIILIFSGCKEIKEYDIHTDLQKSYLEGDYDLIRSYAKGDKELSKPNSISITWEEIKNVTKYDFYLSKDKTFNDCRVYVTNENKIDLINLEINTNYYWYVEYQDENVTNKTDVESFTTVSITPRNLDIEGVTNVRDVGGYKIGKNKYTKQGLIYRSSRFNENESTINLITENGIKEMVDILKVKTELDVRKTSDNENGGITSSPLGESVKYISVPMKSGGNYLVLNTNVLKDIFKVFGDEENYPIVIHCSIGTDRTGLICFLINALLGVELDDLYKDYLFSMFGLINVNRMPSTIDDYIKKISLSKGETLAERTYNYLVNLGVDETDLDNLIKIMT